MNKILFAISLLVFASCSNTTSNRDQLERDEHRQSIRKNLALDNGSRWQLDQHTRQNIIDMKSLLHRADATNFLSVTTLLRAKTDELVQECQMKGPGHDVLHAWLETFMEDQKLVNNPEMEPEKVLAFLRADLKEFDAYFS
ncbi:MAG TPA: hypothetical protein VFT06_09595 [Flavisolibacter sp.]|nr:hypothetical protein [Flavisolibacter sp.]